MNEYLLIIFMEKVEEKVDLEIRMHSSKYDCLIGLDPNGKNLIEPTKTWLNKRIG